MELINEPPNPAVLVLTQAEFSRLQLALRTLLDLVECTQDPNSAVVPVVINGDERLLIQRVIDGK